MSNEKIIALADTASAYLVAETRPSGETFVKFSDDRPEWCQELARHAHDRGEILPDDWRYQFMDRALACISMAAEDDDLDELADDLCGDTYTADLIRWVSSNYNRFGYCDDHLGDASDTIEVIRMGQESEIREVFGLVLEFLREKAEGDEAEE